MLKLCIIAVITAVVAADLDTDWSVFKAKYNKKYTPEAEVIRRFIWSENMKFIEEHNKNFSLGLTSYYLGENEFVDMTSSELTSKMNGRKVKQTYLNEEVPRDNFTLILPDTVDWRSKGFVTTVKNQGQCNSGWAFSATGSMEGQHFKASGKLVGLSESNLIDCSTSFGNHGCAGGSMDNAFRYVIANKGIDTESGYPYKAENNPCEFKESNVGATFTGHVEVTSGSEFALQKAVAEVGPVSVAIDSSRMSFLFYSGGVYDEPNCSRRLLDHGVLVVGYGTYHGKDYWLVKNSWGPSWGQSGYIMMSRNKHNQCGIATKASYPRV